MAMSISSRGSGGRRRGRRGRSTRSGPMAEINVTPMVDVMLVLLIVFMVTAPLMTVGVPINLPQSQAKSLNTEADPITISVTPEGTVFLGEDLVPLGELVARLGEVAVNGTEGRIFVRGDATANYGAVMEVMGALSGAGYSRIGLITEPVQ